MALTKTEVKKAALTLWDQLVRGESEDDAMDVLGFEGEEYDAIRKTMLEEQGTHLRAKPPEHMYVEYMLWQMKGIEDLTDIIKKQKEKPHPNANAMVAAIKVRGDMYDKIIAKGQEFGVLKKTPEKSISIGGHFVADMTSDKLRAQITTAIGDMDKLMKRYGESEMSAIEPGLLHHGPKLLTESFIEAEGTSVEPIAKTVLEAPPAKDDLLHVVAKPKATGPRSPATKGNTSKAAVKNLSSKILPPKTAKIKEEIRQTRYADDFEPWG